MNFGLLLFRLLLVGLLYGHATQKLFGWFRGGGPAGSGVLFEKWGFRPGAAMAVLAGTSELVGAFLIGTGLAAPLGSAIVIGTMIVAASVNVPNGLWAHMGGYEVAFVYAAMAACLGYTGPGAWSLDAAFDFGPHIGYLWGTLALVVGVAASVPPLLRRRQALAATAAPSGVPAQSRESADSSEAADSAG